MPGKFVALTKGCLCFFLNFHPEVISVAAKLWICFLSFLLFHWHEHGLVLCICLPSMDLAVSWYAVSDHYLYIDHLVIGYILLCFAERDLERDWASPFVFIYIQTKAGWSLISFQHLVTVHAFLNQWILNEMSICLKLHVCLHKASRWLFSSASTRCDSVNSISSHFSINHCVFTVLASSKSFLSSTVTDYTYPFSLVLFSGNETDLNVSQH